MAMCPPYNVFKIVQETYWLTYITTVAIKILLLVPLHDSSYGYNSKDYI